MSGQLKEVRNRIKSVNTTQQITKAMKMVSAAKLRRAQDAVLQLRPYAYKLQEMLSNIIGSSNGDVAGKLSKERTIQKVLFIAVSSDRGLCGAFNTNIIKLVKSTIAERYEAQHQLGNVHILPLGKKVYESFTKANYTVIDNFWESYATLSFEKMKEVATWVQQEFVAGNYDKVELVYSSFKNAATQVYVCEPYLPIAKPQPIEGKKTSNDFIFDPGKDVLINELMPKLLNTQVFKAVLDTNASEHGARMTAMDKATENAEEILKGLKISYNRARQATITTELTEIVSGAAALQG